MKFSRFPFWSLLLAAALPASAQFTNINTGLPQTPYPCVVWGDYDGDGDLDVLTAGEGRQNTTFTSIYRNTAGVFANSGIVLPLLDNAQAAWGDFDNDGDLDLAMTGLTPAGLTATRILRNNGATFTAIAGTFTGVYAGSLGWADYDGDGDLDLFVTGATATPAGSPPATRLYRNDAGVFTAVAHPFGDSYLGAGTWADYDNDGDPDLLIAGSGAETKIWRNDGGVFVDSGVVLPSMSIGFAEWGDYDNDGDLDLLFGGQCDDGWVSRIYRNDASVFVDIGASLIGVIWSSAKWGDYDNDGDLDCVVIGYDPVEGLSRTTLYRNDAGAFVDSGIVLHEAWLGLTNWADYDNDGDLDLLIVGNSAGGEHLSLYRNDVVAANTAPTAPASLAAQGEGTSVTLTWSAASDGQTPPAGLTYNVRVGTTAGGNEVLASQSSSAGFRRVPDAGNAGLARVRRLHGLSPGVTYFWSVQSVDASLVASPFAVGGTFTASVDAPQHVALVREVGGSVRVTFRGTPGSVYRIETSDSLAGWLPAAMPTAAAGTGLFEFAEVPPANAVQRFYRAVRP